MAELSLCEAPANFKYAPFTVDQFLSVFERYNVPVWPAQIFLYALGILAICLAFQRTADFSRGIGIMLSMFWLWMGLIGSLLIILRDRIYAIECGSVITLPKSVM